MPVVGVQGTHWIVEGCVSTDDVRIQVESQADGTRVKCGASDVAPFALLLRFKGDAS